MITLYSFGANFGVPEPSPFTLKVDLYMRMAGIEFESIGDAGNLQKAPKGKLPFIKDEGEIVADSYFIFEHLKSKYGNTLDSWLSEEQLAQDYLTTKSLDENFYWCIVHSRWINDDTWPIVKAAFFDPMPIPLRFIVPIIARKSVRKNIAAHGIGRHSEQEILQIAEHNLKSLSTLLGEKQYFNGDKPSSIDATVFAYLAQLILATIDNTLSRKAREFDNLVSYCKRIGKQYYDI